jgi:hypothetical protein
MNVPCSLQANRRPEQRFPDRHIKIVSGNGVKHESFSRHCSWLSTGRAIWRMRRIGTEFEALKCLEEDICSGTA